MLPAIASADPYVETLERRLSTLNRAGVDPRQPLEAALAEPLPLPVEHPAGALWSGLLRHVHPAAPRDPDNPAVDQPDHPQARWTAQLAHAMPGIDQTPGWDRLLATLDRAHTDGYDVSRLLERSLSAKQPIDVRDAVENLRYHVLGSIDPNRTRLRRTSITRCRAATNDDTIPSHQGHPPARGLPAGSSGGVLITLD